MAEEDYLNETHKRFLKALDQLPEPKPSTSADYFDRRLLFLEGLKKNLEILVKKCPSDPEAEWALGYVINSLRKLLPLEKDWQTTHVKQFKPKKAQKIIWDEKARLDDEGRSSYGRSKEILNRHPELADLIKGDPLQYINRTIKKKENSQKYLLA